MFAFYAKRLVSRALFPLPLSLELMAIGLVLLWLTRRQRLGKILITVGAALLLLLSLGPIGEALVTTLEGRYEPYGAYGHFPVPEEEIAYVVVLAGGLPSDPELPITRYGGGDGGGRALEAVRIHRRCPNSKLVLSGGLGADPDAPKELLTNYRFVTMLGVADADIIIQNTSLDTDDEARNIKPIVGDASFVLVTSASHMPRALALFRQQGMDPIPAPTDYRVGPIRRYTLDSLIPSVYALQESETTVYEYLGMLWARLTGQI